MSTPADKETIERQLGVRFERENEQADLERWRNASDAERSRVIVELVEHAEQVAAITGIRNHDPAPRLPKPDRAAAEGHGR